MKGSLAARSAYGRFSPLVGHLAAGRVGAGLEAREHTWLQCIEAIEVRGTDVPLRGGVLRDDVRLVAAVGEDAVDPLVRSDVLAKRGHVHVPEHGGVERVPSLVREGRGVGRLTVVLGPDLLDGDGVHRREVGAGRVHHHRRVDAVERAVVGHANLASPTLLGRRAQDDARGRRARRRATRRPGRRRARRRR